MADARKATTRTADEAAPATSVNSRRIDERFDIIAKAADELDGVLAGIARCVCENGKGSLDAEQVPAAVRALVLRGIVLANTAYSAARRDPGAGAAETPIEDLRREVEVLRG